MVAKLTAPDGRVTELTDEQYLELQTVLISKLPTRKKRLMALLELIEATKEEGDDEWWAEFDQFLRENRVSFSQLDIPPDDD